jgi:hemerythrin-like metal-binding protein
MGVKMEKICWKEEYSVGIEKIDHQHQHLFEIVNNLIERSVSSGDSELASETLTEMINYAREHFTTEETLMEKYGYPEIEPHKKEHDYFINTTAELAIGFMDNKNTTAGEIAEFLILWLSNHILKSDMKYKPFFKAKISSVAEYSI